jgi:hypothetical protein
MKDKGCPAGGGRLRAGLHQARIDFITQVKGRGPLADKSRLGWGTFGDTFWGWFWGVVPGLKLASTFLPSELVPCTIGSAAALPQTAAVRERLPRRESGMEAGYAVWMGQPVVLRVMTGDLRVPLRGKMLSETSDVVRLRIADCWDVDIFKSMVVGIEHDNQLCMVN